MMEKEKHVLLNGSGGRFLGALEQKYRLGKSHGLDS